MPTATSFAALGRGNGFPFCPPKVNVSVYDYWTTLDGVNKDGGTVNIAASTAAAMKFFWNFHQLKGTVRVVIDDPPFDLVDVTLEDIALSEEPNERICSQSLKAEKELDPPRASAEINVLIRRFYDGPVDDEDNFVGYGAGLPQSQSTPAFSLAGTPFGPDLSALYISGAWNEESSTSSTINDYAYVTLGGLHYVALARARIGATTISSTVEAENLLAFTEFFNPSANFTASSRCEITDVDFYTY